MRWLWFALAGVAGGVLAGMGMGGGTLTIPLLVLMLDTQQLTAQFVNLIAFLPAGFIALMLHMRNKLVKAKTLPYVLIPALLTTVAASFFAAQSTGELLGKLFGGFLIAIALSSFVASAVKNQSR